MRLNKFFKRRNYVKNNWEHVTVKADIDGIPKEVSEGLKNIKATMGDSTDIVTSRFKIGKEGSVEVGISYLDGLADKTLIQEFIIEPLKTDSRISQLDPKVIKDTSLIDVIKDFNIVSGEISEIADMKTLYTHLLRGDTVLLIDGCQKGLAINSRGGEVRGVEEPTSQTVVR